MSTTQSTETMTQRMMHLVETIISVEADSLAAEDFPPRIMWFKNDQPVAMLFPNGAPEQHVAIALKGASVAIQGDYMVAFNDAYAACSATRKDGSPWGPGDMKYALEHNTEDADLVRENVSIVMATAEGWCASANLPYDRVDGQIQFRRDLLVLVVEDVEHPELSVGGRQTRAMRDAMATDCPPQLRPMQQVDLRVALDSLVRFLADPQLAFVLPSD